MDTVEKYTKHAMCSGAALGAGYYALKDETKTNTLGDTVFGAAFSIGAGGLLGLGVLCLHPLVIGGVITGIPTHMIRKAQS